MSPPISLDDVDLSKYLDPATLTYETAFTSGLMEGEWEATLYPPATGRQPYNLTYSDWHHDFGFRRKVIFGEASEDEDGISLPFWWVDE